MVTLEYLSNTPVYIFPRHPIISKLHRDTAGPTAVMVSIWYHDLLYDKMS